MIVELLIFAFILLFYFQYKTQKRPNKFPPGPIGLPLLGYMPFLKLPFEKGLAKLSEKYGGIYSIFLASYPAVVISDVSIMKEILKDDRFLGRPQTKPFIERSWGKPKGIIFTNGRDWTEQRRFTLKNLRDLGFGRGSMESLIKDEVVDVISQFRNSLGKPISIETSFSIAVLNSLWHIIAGERYAHDDPRLLKIIARLNEAINEAELAGPIFFFDWFTNIFPNWSGYNKFLSAYLSTVEFLKEFVDSHRKTLDVNNPRDFIDAYLKEIESTTDSTSGFHDKEGIQSLQVVLLDLFSAGADTTSQTLTWSILYLITFPEIQDKLFNEIVQVVGKERLPALADKQSMNYLESFIAETMRMSSITPISGRAATEDLEFHGYFIPKGTMVLGNYWQMHHDHKIWTNPESFKPERFLSPEGKFLKNDNLIAFSAGKRSCLGESLARNELFLFLSCLLQVFKFSTDPSSPPPSLVGCTGSITKPKPFKVVISLRT